MHEHDINLAGHRSKPLTIDAVTEAQLVIALSRDHLREVILLDPRTLQRAFTLKELVRRAAAAGTRPRPVELADWLAILASDRDPRHLLGGSRDDDIADPIGKPRSAIRRTAADIDELVGRAVESLWSP
jgi:protein-tyrosine phosphatase